MKRDVRIAKTRQKKQMRYDNIQRLKGGGFQYTLKVGQGQVVLQLVSQGHR